MKSRGKLLLALICLAATCAAILPSCSDVEVNIDTTEEVADTPEATVARPVDKISAPSTRKGQTATTSTTVEQESNVSEPPMQEVGFTEGTSGEEVRFLQETMLYQGQLSSQSDVDGIWGPNTSRAFAMFEQANGWKVDGTMTLEEFEVLMNEIYGTIQYEIDDVAYDYTDDQAAVVDEELLPTTDVVAITEITPQQAHTPCDSPDWFTNNPANTVTQSELVVYYRRAATSCPPGTLVNHSATSWLRNAGF